MDTLLCQPLDKWSPVEDLMVLTPEHPEFEVGYPCFVVHHWRAEDAGMAMVEDAAFEPEVGQYTKLVQVLHVNVGPDRQCQSCGTVVGVG